MCRAGPKLCREIRGSLEVSVKLRWNLVCAAMGLRKLSGGRKQKKYQKAGLANGACEL